MENLISEINTANIKKFEKSLFFSFCQDFLQIVARRRTSLLNDKSCVNKPICNLQFTAGKKNKHVICRLRSVRMVKNCDLGLENAARSRKPSVTVFYPAYGPPSRQMTYISYLIISYDAQASVAS